jgi:hypothetical protein
MSRFENEEIDLTDDVVGTLSLSLGLDYEDLMIRGILKDSIADNWQYLASEQWDSTKVHALLVQLRSLEVPDTKNNFITTASAVIGELLRIHEHNGGVIRNEVVQLLDSYLKKISEYSRLDGILFSVCTEYIDVHVGWKWVSYQINGLALGSNKQAKPQQIRRVISFCAGVAERAALENRLVTMQDIINEMQLLRKYIPENANQQYSMEALQALCVYLGERSARSRERLATVMKAGAYIFPTDVHRSMVQYTIEQGWATAEDFADDPLI